MNASVEGSAVKSSEWIGKTAPCYMSTKLLSGLSVIELIILSYSFGSEENDYSKFDSNHSVEIFQLTVLVVA